MLYFLLTKRTRYTVQQLLTRRGKHLTHLIELLFYEDLHLTSELRPGALAFLDMDRMPPLANAAAASVHEYLSTVSDRISVLNHPIQTLSRYHLLKKLHALGINDFRICKASEDLSALKMPVYLRTALGHNRILSGLLKDQRSLRHAIQETRVLGHSPEKIYVVEFCDTSDERGIFTKYSALKIGDNIFPRHVNFDDQWIVKSSAAQIDHDLHMSHRDHIDWYFTTHPHKEWLEKVFNIAGIGYGRADYSVLNGKPQLWEINTNPSFSSGRSENRNSAYHEAEEPYKLMFFEGFTTAIKNLAAETHNGISIPLQPVYPFTLQIHNYLKSPEELVKSPALLLKMKNSKKWWVVAAWNVLVKIYSVCFPSRKYREHRESQ